MKMDIFNEVSLRGRVAYAILCAEKYFTVVYPDRDWKIIFEICWRFTDDSMYLDAWADSMCDILPECLLEFDGYNRPDGPYEYITEEQYTTIKNLYAGIKDDVNVILKAIRDMEEEYAYTVIEEYGKGSIETLSSIVKMLEEKNIALPDPQLVAFSKFSEEDGWGKAFDGTKLSMVLKG
ncbi:MAG: hypothetical protein ACI38O_05370 [Fibrobacter intestinalis]|uniref:DUF4303 domain-containing protein n=1 Tax=Fibrobacter intestinalis TaxID=28122 RepID=A0A1T4PHX2_9BACT|nr:MULTISPECIES: hypothetical protein [Fibrobacter]PBC74629.1 hypothetical protein BGW94_2295 [Fibrobacter sp. NR9]SJZ91133.1 hypothetical protein SAMN02745108_01940 [Fibrobacter intestinalis]